MRKVGSILSTLLIIVLIALLALVLIPKLFFGVEMKAVQTASMEPDLPVGSLIVIVPTAYEDISIGDDITYVRDEKLTLVTHRVIAKDDETKTVTTQGIANNTADNPTSYENVVGKVVFHIPLIGYALIWISTTEGKIIAAIIVIALVAVSLLFGKVKPDKKDKPKKESQ